MSMNRIDFLDWQLSFYLRKRCIPRNIQHLNGTCLNIFVPTRNLVGCYTQCYNSTVVVRNSGVVLPVRNRTISLLSTHLSLPRWQCCVILGSCEHISCVIQYADFDLFSSFSLLFLVCACAIFCIIRYVPKFVLLCQELLQLEEW